MGAEELSSLAVGLSNLIGTFCLNEVLPLVELLHVAPSEIFYAWLSKGEPDAHVEQIGQAFDCLVADCGVREVDGVRYLDQLGKDLLCPDQFVEAVFIPENFDEFLDPGLGNVVYAFFHVLKVLDAEGLAFLVLAAAVFEGIHGWVGQ